MVAMKSMNAKSSMKVKDDFVTSAVKAATMSVKVAKASAKGKKKSILDDIEEWAQEAVSPKSLATSKALASKKVLKRPAARLANRITGDESEEEGGDRNGQPRDRHKSDWIKRHRAEIPDNVLAVLDRGSQIVGQQKPNTDLVNNMIRRDSDGIYHLDLSNPFVEDRRIYIMCLLNFNNGSLVCKT